MNITIGNRGNWKIGSTRYVVALGGVSIALGIAVASVISQPSASPNADLHPGTAVQVQPFTAVEYAGVGLAYVAPSTGREAVVDNAAYFNGMTLAYETAKPNAFAPAVADVATDVNAAFEAMTLAYETARLSSPR
ncbi:MAG TPA: hypothetical protein VI876_08125 [Dehalococcoidia bacterium]|nr:hypothetical protein [Dehalococcoidia bacterium]